MHSTLPRRAVRALSSERSNRPPGVLLVAVAVVLAVVIALGPLGLHAQTPEARYAVLAAAADHEGLVALWREHPDAAIPVIDRDLEGSLALWEADAVANAAEIDALLTRAAAGARAAVEATGRRRILDYVTSFIGWSPAQKRAFRAGQRACREGGAALRGGDAATALARGADCRTLAEPLGDWWGTAMGLRLEGGARRALGEPQEAATALSRARLVFRELGLTSSALQIEADLAEILAGLGARPRAEAIARDGIETAERLGLDELAARFRGLEDRLERDGVASVRTIDQTSGTDALLIAVHPVDTSVVWVAGTRGTWLRTVDGGTSWSVGRVPGADSLQFRDVHALDRDRAWLLSIGNGADSRIYHTDDGGATWTLQFMGDDPRGFYDCLDFWDERRGVVIGDEVDGAVSMLETHDGGARWSRVPVTRLPGAQPGEGSFAASGTCLRAGPQGRAWIVASNAERGRLLRTADFGATWTADVLPLTVRSGVGPQSVSFRDATHGMVLQGGADSRADDVGAAFSDDGGVTWTVRTRPPLAVGVWGSAWVPGATPPALVAVSPSGAAYTRDDGRSWTVIDAHDYWAVAFASGDAGWAVGRGGRITKLSGF